MSSIWSHEEKYLGTYSSQFFFRILPGNLDYSLKLLFLVVALCDDLLYWYHGKKLHFGGAYDQNSEFPILSFIYFVSFKLVVQRLGVLERSECSGERLI